MVESILNADERRNGDGARNLTSDSTGAESAYLSSRTWMPFDDSSRPVNRGVRFLLNAVAQMLNQPT